MAVPYPSSPAVGDTFTYEGILYTWTGVAWISTFVRTPGTVGSVTVVAPITNSGTPTAPVVGLDQSALLIGQSQVTNLVSDLAAKASTSDLTSGLALKANLAGGNSLTEAQTITGSVATSTPLTLRGASGQTASLFEIRNSSNTLLSYTLSNGDWVMPNLFNSYAGVGTGYSDYQGTVTSLYVRPTATTRVGAIIRGLASQTANLEEWQNSAGTVLARVDNVGDITARVLRSTFAARIQTNDAQTAVIVSTAAANQSADHLQYQNSVGTVLGGTTANGFQYIGSATSLRFLNYTLTAASASSTTVATFTYNTVSTVNQVAVGQKVVVSGVTPSSYNGSFNVTAIGGSSGAWTFTVTAPSAPFTVGSATGFGTFSLDTGLSVQTLSAGMPGLIIRGVASQVANIFEYRNAGNSLQTYITPAGDFVAPAISAIWAITSSAQDVTVNAMRARTSVASGYRANLQTWESSTTVLAGINSPGKFFTGGTSGITAGVGGTIQSIATGANPLVTMASAHGLAVGDVVVLAGTTGGTYNGTFFVATVPASTTFTITSALTAGQAGAAGTVSVASQVSVTARSAGVKGLVIQGAASQTANLFEVQNSAGSLLARVESSGNFVISGIGVTSGDHRVGTSTYFSAALNVLARATTEIGVVVRGQASQTANLQEWQNSAASVVARVEPTGKIVGGQNITALGSIHSFNLITSGTNETQLDSATLSVGTRAAGNIGAIIRGAASQTADLQQWQNSAGTVLSEISASGSFYVNSNNNTIGVEFLGTAGTQFITANGNDMLLRPRFDVLFAPADSSGRLRPSNDNTSDLGTSGQRWKTLFASGATLNSLTLTGTTSPITLNGSVGTSGQVLTSAGAGATPTWTTVSGGGSFTGGTLTGNLTLAAGTTSLSPLTFQSGTNLTTVTAGANEYDGTVFYKTSNTNPGRALATQNYYYVASTDWNPDFSTSSIAKSLLGAATRGITVAAGTTYEFELYTTIQHDFVTTSGVSASVDIFNTTVTGSPVVSDVMFVDFSSNTTGFTTSATMSSVRSTTAVTVSAAISSGSRFTIVKAKGIIRITGTGTTKIYPGIQTTSASGDNGWTIGTGTTFKMTPIGNGTVTTVGTWA